MAPQMWAFVEAILVERLLRSPSFHRAVQNVHKNVHRIRHGTPPEEMGGTKIDRPGGGFLNHFKEEVLGQLGRTPANRISGTPSRTSQAPPQQSTTQSTLRPDQPRKPPEQPGYLSQFVNEIREQVRRNSTKR